MNVDQQVQFRLDHLTKPQGSLGLLEGFVLQLGKLQQTDRPQAKNKRLLILAGDHGITTEGMSAFPASVTFQMVLNFASGGAAINVLAKKYQEDLHVVDVGVNGEFDTALPILHKKIGKGTKNFLQEEALSEEELERAFAVGEELVIQAKKDNIHLLGVGEMGIGNTSSASILTAALLKKPIEEVTGRGTGINDDQLAHKIAILRQAFDKRDLVNAEPREILRRVGGFEIATITGIALSCAKYQIALVADGFISTVGIAYAAAIDPRVREITFPSHRSQEKGHVYLLEYLDIKSFLGLEMRLGEGSGAAIAMDVIDTAVHLYNEMATFEDAQVSKKI